MDKKRPISDKGKRISQLEERKRHIEQLTKERERKKRANRLIQTGALVEKYLDMEHLSINDREQLLKIFSDYINTNKPNKFKNN